MNNDNSTSCYLQARLEEIATLQRQCSITYLNKKNECIKVDGRIVDIYASDGTDWCKLNDGTVICLDKIEEFESE